MTRYKKPRRWQKIISQEGVTGLLAGEDPEVEYSWRGR